MDIEMDTKKDCRVQTQTKESNGCFFSVVPLEKEVRFSLLLLDDPQQKILAILLYDRMRDILYIRFLYYYAYPLLGEFYFKKWKVVW